MLDHHAAGLAAEIDRLGIAKKCGQRPIEVIIGCGGAPAVAARWLRVGRGLAVPPRLAAHTELGAMSVEHADAVVSGVTHVATRLGDEFDDEHRESTLSELLAQSNSGAVPQEITAHARAIGNALAHSGDSGDEPDDRARPRPVPAGEDRRINSFTASKEPGGRVIVHGDLDLVTGEKLFTALDAYAACRPEPDGGRDARSTELRQADGFAAILDVAALAGSGPDAALIGAPRTTLLLTVPASNPDLSRLAHVGPVTAQTAAILACDAAITRVVVDDASAPVSVSEEKRFFSGRQRKALIVRDRGCVKCGAAASRCEGHHIVFWSNGGTTTIDNGCLLCSACHTAVHNDGWEIIMGHDRHPWLRPPATVDRRRRLQPSYHRRTMRLDDVA